MLWFRPYFSPTAGQGTHENDPFDAKELRHGAEWEQVVMRCHPEHGEAVQADTDPGLRARQLVRTAKHAVAVQAHDRLYAIET